MLKWNFLILMSWMTHLLYNRDMEPLKQNTDENLGKIINSLVKIDSSIRNGQFLYAHREINKLLAEITRGEYNINQNNTIAIVASIKRTILFLRPMVKAYSQNQTSLDIVRRISKC